MLNTLKLELREIFADLFDRPYELDEFEINELNFINPGSIVALRSGGKDRMEKYYQVHKLYDCGLLEISIFPESIWEKHYEYSCNIRLPTDRELDPNSKRILILTLKNQKSFNPKRFNLNEILNQYYYHDLAPWASSTKYKRLTIFWGSNYNINDFILGHDYLKLSDTNNTLVIYLRQLDTLNN